MADAEVEIVRDLRIPIDGGLTLAANLYREGGSGARPTILVALPYLKDAIAGVENGWVLDQFARAGFNALLIDLRGCGGSEGIAREPFAADDVQDSLAAIDWVRTQDWCDGRIGFWGASYGGIMALRTAAARPAGLKAIVAIESASDSNAEFVRPNGVLGNISPMGLWPTGDLVMQCLPPLYRDDAGDWKRIWEERLRNIRPRLFDYLSKPSDDPSWDANKVEVEAVDVPALIVAGWRDFFCAPSLSIYQRLRCEKNLIVGPWSHMLPDMAPLAPIDLTGIAINWWRRWLLEDEAAVSLPAPVTAYVEELGEWHGFDAWPPAGESINLFAGDQSFAPVQKPVDPCVGYRDGLWGIPLPTVPFDSREDNQSGINLTSAPFSEEVIIACAPVVQVQLSGKSVGVDWLSAKLSVIEAGGKARLVASGAGIIDQVRRTTITLTDSCIAVKAGQCLQLTLSAADFPRHWPQADAQVLAIDEAPSLEITTVAASHEMKLPQHHSGINFVPLARSMVPEWSVTEDLLTSTVTLALGQDASSFTVDRQSILSMKNRVTSSVSRLIPDLSKVEGTVTATVETEGQPTIKVEGQLTVLSDFAQAQLMVYEGDELLLDKNWSFELAR